MNLPLQTAPKNNQPASRSKEESVNQNRILNETQARLKEPASSSDLAEDALKERSSYGSSPSVNELIISEFTLEEVNEILNCKLSDDEDNELLNDTNYTRTLLQQEFSHARSLQHLNDLERSERTKTTENGLRLAETGNPDELNEKLLSTKNDLIRNLASLDVSNERRAECAASAPVQHATDRLASKLPEKAASTFESRFDHKFTNQIDRELDAECLNESATSNLRKTGYHKVAASCTTKLGCSSKQAVKGESADHEKPIDAGNEIIANAKANDSKDSESAYYLSTAELVEKDHRPAISPPPEFQSSNDHGRDQATKLNDELKHQFKRQFNLNKHLQSRWSSVDGIQKQQTAQNSKPFDRLNAGNPPNVTALPPPVSFSGSSSPSSRPAGGHHSDGHHSSMLALPNQPKLPTKDKGDLLNANSKPSTAKKLPNKLKSLPEMFTKSLYATNKLIEERTSNTFTSTSLVSQMKSQQQQLTSTGNQLSVSCQISQRPLPPLPLNLEAYCWFHNLEREASSQLLEQFGVEGSYLVRTSKRAGIGSPYSLSIYHDGKCFNLNIRKREDGLFALGKEKEKEKVNHCEQFSDAFHCT